MKALLTALIFISSSAHAIYPKQCQVFTDYLLKSTSASEVCEKGGGFHCANAKSDAEKICQGLGGTYCVNLQNIAQAYCMASGGSYCDKVESSELSAYQQKLKSKCDEMINAAIKKTN